MFNNIIQRLLNNAEDGDLLGRLMSGLDDPLDDTTRDDVDALVKALAVVREVFG